MTEDINTETGVVLEAINGKVDMPDNTAQDKVDYVVEQGGDASKWYRLWKSGWLEQGGFQNPDTSADWTITLIKSYKDDQYVVLSDTLNVTTRETDYAVSTRVWSKLSTSFSIRVEVTSGGSATKRAFSWKTEGFS